MVSEFVSIDHKRFRMRRENMGLSQRQLGILLGTTQSAVSRSERKPGAVGIDKFRIFTTVLGVTPEWLQGKADAPEPPPAPRPLEGAESEEVLVPVSLKDAVPFALAPVDAPEVVATPAPSAPPVALVVAPAPVAQTAARAVPEGLEDIFQVLVEEQRAGIEDGHRKVEALRTGVASGAAAFKEGIAYVLIALEEYENALRKDVQGAIRSRVSGTPATPTNGTAARMVLEQVTALATGATTLANDLKALLGSVPPAPQRPLGVIAPTPSAPAVVPTFTIPPKNREPLDADALVEGVKPTSLVVETPAGYAPYVAPVVTAPVATAAPVEAPGKATPLKFLLVGGTYCPHPDCIRNVLRQCNVDLVWLDAPKKRSGPVDDAAEKIRNGGYDGLVIIGGYISHGTRDKVVDAAALSKTPIGYSHGQGSGEILRSVRSVLSLLNKANNPS